MSKHIAGLKVGDTLDFKGPMPKLPYAANEFDAVGMVAGGTGITPMLQVLEKALADPADATTFALLFGNVTPDDILLKGRLDALAAAHPGRFAVEYYVDAPPSWWRGGRGYVDKKAIARFLPAATQKTKILVCGPPGLVEMVAGAKVSFKDQGPVGGHLADLGFSRDQVYKF
jgi:cytochrome-b5 reductase